MRTLRSDSGAVGGRYDRFCTWSGGRRIVSENETITGFLARNGDDIHALYIDPKARGQGIGSKLLTNAMHQEDQLTLWTFQANTRAQAFYERHGFTPVEHTGGAGNDEGLPDIRYLWQRTDT